MRFYIVTVLFFISTVQIFSQKKLTSNEFIINGKLLGYKNGKLYISYPDQNGIEKIDSSKVTNGYFNFKGNIIYPTKATINLNPSNRKVEDLNYCEFYIEPKKISLILNKNDFKNLKITGSKTQKEYEIFLNLKKPVYDSIQTIKTKINLISSAHSKTDSLSNEADSISIYTFNNLIQKLRDSATSIDVNFFNTNPQSFITPELLLLCLEKVSFNIVKDAYNTLKPSVKASFMGKIVAKEITKRVNSMPGSFAPDFIVKDINNKILSLSMYKELKYVILDFWASWCLPCRENFPHLKKIYTEYSSKGLEIISISIDESEELWHKAIIKDSISDWKHVSGFVSFEKKNKRLLTNQILDNYYLNGIPAIILINKVGIIVGRWDGQSKKNDQSLDSLLFNTIGKESAEN